MSFSQPNSRELFDMLIELPLHQQRLDWLENHCHDPRQRIELQELLSAHDQADEFLMTPAYNLNQDSLDLFYPDKIGAYDIIGFVGEGGFGQVFAAQQEGPIKQRVAIKVLRPGIISDELIARFEAERQALSMMDHPNIARVFEGGTTEQGRPYFVMEWVPGKPITDLADEHQYTIKERLRIFIDVCRAVEHAHQKGIIHRDLKPTNILVRMQDQDPVPKVIDFGVAKAIEHPLIAQPAETAGNQMLGTPHYMSPEQSGLGSEAVDTRSDVYSLGVILYELLTGSTIFDPKSLQGKSVDEFLRWRDEFEPSLPSDRLFEDDPETTHSKAQKRRRTPIQLSSLLMGELDCISLKALARDPNRRYQSATELADDVQRFLDGDIVLARPSSRWYLAQKFIRRHRGACAAIAMLAMILILATAFSLRQARVAEHARRLETQRRQHAEALRDTLLLTLDSPNPDFQLPQHLPTTSHAAVYGFKYGKAAERYQMALSELEKSVPASDPQVLVTRLQLAICGRKSGNPEFSRTYVEPAIQLASQTLGKDHIITLLCRVELAASQVALNEFDQGIENLNECLNLAKSVEGPNGILAYKIHHQLSEAHERQHNFTESLAELDRALEVAETNSNKVTSVIYSQLRKGLVLRQLGKPNHAYRELISAVEKAQTSLGPEHSLLLNTEYQLAKMDRFRGDETRAISRLENVLNACRQSKRHIPLMTDVVFELAAAYYQTDQKEKSLRLGEELLKAIQQDPIELSNRPF